MPLLSFKTENNVIVENFLLMLEGNLNKNNMFKNPFSNSRVHYSKGKETIFAVVDLNSIYPNLTLFTFILTAISLLFYLSFTTKLFAIITIIIAVISMISGFVNSDKFYKIILEKGLRKKGYEGYINYISTKDLCINLIFGVKYGSDRDI